MRSHEPPFFGSAHRGRRWRHSLFTARLTLMGLALGPRAFLRALDPGVRRSVAWFAALEVLAVIVVAALTESIWQGVLAGFLGVVCSAIGAWASNRLHHRITRSTRRPPR